MILGAIDIGSNAARLLICEVVKNGTETEFNKLNLLQFIEISDLKNHKKIAKELENYMVSKKKICSNLYNSSKIKFNKSLNLIEKNI